MDERLSEPFEACIQILEKGGTLEDCLKQYPALATDLKPRLETVLKTLAFMASIQPQGGSLQASRERFMAQAARLQPARAVQPGLQPGSERLPSLRETWDSLLGWLLGSVTHPAFKLITILIVIGLAGTATLTASAHSFPGSPLYELKRSIENTQLAFSPSQSAKVELQNEFSERRLQELDQVTGRGLKVEVEFGGQVTQIEAGKWSVDHFQVILPKEIQISGIPADGLYVWVRGETQPDHSVLAKQIQVVGLRVTGSVQEIQARVWRIDERLLYISSDTSIKDPVGLGDRVRVNVWVLADGSWLAEDIQLLSRAAHPSAEPERGTSEDGSDPDPTSAVPARPTASPTHQEPQQASPTPLKDSGSGKIIDPGRTSEPTRTPEPSRTSAPTHTPDYVQPSPAPSQARPQEVRLEGKLEAVNGRSWTVAGQVFQLDGSTAVEGNPQAGDLVEIRAVRQADGSLLAVRIRKR